MPNEKISVQVVQSINHYAVYKDNQLMGINNGNGNWSRALLDVLQTAKLISSPLDQPASYKLENFTLLEPMDKFPADFKDFVPNQFK